MAKEKEQSEREQHQKNKDGGNGGSGNAQLFSRIRGGIAAVNAGAKERAKPYTVSR